MQAIIDATVRKLQETGAKAPKYGLILGSGLGDYAQTLEHGQAVDYADIPGFPHSNVPGHAARFVLGERFGKPLIAMQGRVHYYEGYPQSLLTTGVRAMRALGVEQLLITNAAGGVNPAYPPGTLMLIEDHINFSGSHPLIGENMDTFGPRFPDLSDVYTKELRDACLRVAASKHIPLQSGVYMMFSGPSYETPAEIRMARAMGADAVGMSTVPEAIVAAHCGMQVVGVSLITNAAAGMLPQALSHIEVQEMAATASKRFTELVDCILEQVFFA